MMMMMMMMMMTSQDKKILATLLHPDSLIGVRASVAVGGRAVFGIAAAVFGIAANGTDKRSHRDL